ncbi:MAG: accessory factor UbiK family protein [Thiohalocapsa sp.]|nr:accessory factor UbiK family protein [Thiohalocapsa sp.]MCF7988817.1 accessory factor UbiK family protein [Thiohalocapsa sp.]
MVDPKQLDDLVRRLAASMPKGVQVLQEDVTRSFRATLESGLDKLDLVTRDEFDVQAAVLARTRSKLEALEAKVAELEAAAPAAAKTRSAKTATAGTGSASAGHRKPKQTD